MLHRRAPLIREKIIHRLHLTKINTQNYLCNLITSAGTYVKEFIHSDLGRTQPSLCSLTKQQLDII